MSLKSGHLSSPIIVTRIQVMEFILEVTPVNMFLWWVRLSLVAMAMLIASSVSLSVLMENFQMNKRRRKYYFTFLYDRVLSDINLFFY